MQHDRRPLRWRKSSLIQPDASEVAMPSSSAAGIASGTNLGDDRCSSWAGAARPPQRPAVDRIGMFRLAVPAALRQPLPAKSLPRLHYSSPLPARARAGTLEPAAAKVDGVAVAMLAPVGFDAPRCPTLTTISPLIASAV
jgi:hypothetical protein